MSLTDTINNTNTQKENIKIVATNIDNKLAELGGERATNLNDVPNKMEGMVGQYKRVAIVNPNTTVFKIPTNPYNLKINVNLPFIPSRVFVKIMLRYPSPFSESVDVYSNATLDSKYHKALNFTPYDDMFFQTTGWNDVNYLHIPIAKGIAITKYTSTEVVIRIKSSRNISENDIKIQEILALE